jgi:hypothetical protein
MFDKSSSNPMAKLGLRHPHDIPGIIFRVPRWYFGLPDQQSYASEPENPKSLTPIDILNFYCIDSNTPFACLASYGLHAMGYPETWGPTDFDSDSLSWAYQNIVSLSNLNLYLNYLSLDLLFPADDPIICLNCDKIKDDSPDDMSNLLSRSRRLKLLSFIGFGVLTLVVLILRSGFTWSGIGSRFTHWGQSRSTKMSDDTFSTRRAIKWEVERPWASWRTRIRRIGFIFRVSCLPFILVCICGTAALVIDLFQRLTLVRWHLSKLTCSPNSHIPPTPFSGTVTWIATSTLFPRSSFL